MTQRPAPVVLLIDDHDDTRDMYAVALRQRGFDVYDAADGPAALRQASEHAPSIIVTDLRLRGEVSGLDLCGHFGQQGIPVIVLTGVTGARAHEKVRRAGCRALLVKPVAPDTVETEIRRILTEPRSWSVASGTVHTVRHW